MRYSVTVEGTDGSHVALIHELSGCTAWGATAEEALAALPAAVRAFRDFFAPAGGLPPEPEGFDLVQPAGGVTEMFLTWHRQPLTWEEWSRIERWLNHSRRELLQTLDAMREEDLETRAHDRARTIAQQLQHIAYVEYMYAYWTFDFASRAGLGEFLDWTRRAVLERMRELAGRNDGQVTQAQWAGDPEPEPWTARKAARRLVYHELWHLRSIRRLLRGFRGKEASGANP